MVLTIAMNDQLHEQDDVNFTFYFKDRYTKGFVWQLLLLTSQADLPDKTNLSAWVFLTIGQKIRCDFDMVERTIFKLDTINENKHGNHVIEFF
jgi:hypothetical protein